MAIILVMLHEHIPQTESSNWRDVDLETLGVIIENLSNWYEKATPLYIVKLIRTKQFSLKRLEEEYEGLKRSVEKVDKLSGVKNIDITLEILKTAGRVSYRSESIEESETEYWNFLLNRYQDRWGIMGKFLTFQTKRLGKLAVRVFTSNKKA